MNYVKNLARRFSYQVYRLPIITQAIPITAILENSHSRHTMNSGFNDADDTLLAYLGYKQGACSSFRCHTYFLTSTS
jgi:hypothetical protein